MAEKQNCWDIEKCGREVGGPKVHEFGVCPAATDVTADGLNGGKNGGRICWAITGTFCGGEIQGIFAEKITSCMACTVLKRVMAEEAASGRFMLMKPGQVYQPPSKD